MEKKNIFNPSFTTRSITTRFENQINRRIERIKIETGTRKEKKKEKLEKYLIGKKHTHTHTQPIKIVYRTRYETQ